MQVDFFPIHSQKHYLKYAVIQVRFENRWVFVRHKDRTTWEMVGGHIEKGETPNEAAVRELMEESGAVDFHLFPVCDYSVSQDNGSGKIAGYGRLYVADVYSFGELEYEIEEIQVRDHLPRHMTYPLIQPKLYKKICDYLDKRGMLVQLSDFSKEDNYDLVDTLRNRFSRGDHELAYISSSTDTKRKHFFTGVDSLKAYGNFTCAYFDFDDEYVEGQEERILHSQIIYLSDGDTGYFLECLKRYGMLEKLRDFYYRGGVIIGQSAGAMLMGDDIGYSQADSGNKLHSEDTRALDLVVYDFIPHWKTDPWLEKEYLDYKGRGLKDMVTCEDGSGLVLDKDLQRFGQVKKLSNLQKK